MNLPTRQRQAVRAMLLTDAHSVLLLRLKNPRGVFWIAPGGGIDEGESDHEALHRELFEETGLESPRIGPLIWTRQTSYVQNEDTPDAAKILQSERFFLVPVKHFDAHAHNMPQEVERDWFQNFGWLTADDIDGSDERILPTTLAHHLRVLVRDGAPSAPIDVGR